MRFPQRLFSTFLLFLAAQLLLCGVGLAQSTLTFQQGQNGYSHLGSFIRNDSTNATVNSGARDQILVGRGSNAFRGVLSFDLSLIPVNATITSVSLDLWTDPTSTTAAPGTVGTLELHLLNDTPIEGTGDGVTAGSGSGTGVTWLSRTGGTTGANLWSVAGGDFSAGVLSSVPGFLAATPNVQKTFASSASWVTSVQTALASATPLNLIVTAPSSETGGNNNYTRLVSDDGATTSKRPKLSVSFTVSGIFAPTYFNATSVGWSQIRLDWNDLSSQETGFTIERSLGTSGSWSPIITVGPNVTSILDSGLESGTEYRYRIKASFSTGDSSYMLSNAITTQIVTSRPPIVILPLGDSITFGQGSTNGGGYRSPLYVSLTNAGYNTVNVGSLTTNPDTVLTAANNVRHQGHKGQAISYIQANLDLFLNGSPSAIPPIPPIHPDVILLMIGTNDIGSGGRSSADTLASYDTLITSIAALRPSALIVGCTLVPYVYTPGVSAIGYATREPRQLEFNAGLPALIANHQAAGERVILCDMRTQVTAAGISGDGVHPNNTGYTQIASVWFEAFKTLPLVENWRFANFGSAADSGNGAYDADPDNDGSSNLLEYAFGTVPTSAASRSLTPVGVFTDSSGANYLQITFSRRRNADLRYQAQTSGDIGGWKNEAIQVGPAVVLNADFEQVIYRDSQPITSNNQRFMRVKVSLP
jgi:lysophospholipase L1-like esterase